MAAHRACVSHWLLALASTGLALLVGVAAYERYRSGSYHAWKQRYRVSSYHYGGVTVASPNPELIWEYRPSASYVHWKPRYLVKTDEFGFRKNVPGPNPAADFTSAARIAFVGDSVTFGLNVESEYTFASRVQRLANRRAPAPIAVWNFGVDGYSARQIHELLIAKVLPRRPSRVLYVLPMNDFDFDEGSERKVYFFQEPHSHFLTDLRRIFARRYRAEYHTFHYERNADELFELVERMRTRTIQSGASFEVVLIPAFPRHGSFRNYPLRQMHDEILTRLRSLGLAPVDLLPVFERRGGLPRDYALDWWHLNEAGHRLVGDHLWESIAATEAPRRSRTGS